MENKSMHQSNRPKQRRLLSFILLSQMTAECAEAFLYYKIITSSFMYILKKAEPSSTSSKNERFNRLANKDELVTTGANRSKRLEEPGDQRVFEGQRWST